MDATAAEIAALRAEVADLKAVIAKMATAGPAEPEPERMLKDAARRRSFGWAYVAKRADGSQVIDWSGDRITQPDQVEETAYRFVRNGRGADLVHNGEPVARMIESLALTPEKVEKMGAVGILPQSAHWVGFEWSPEAWPRVASGELGMFSWGGRGRRKPVG